MGKRITSGRAAPGIGSDRDALRGTRSSGKHAGASNAPVRVAYARIKTSWPSRSPQVGHAASLAIQVLSRLMILVVAAYSISSCAAIRAPVTEVDLDSMIEGMEHKSYLINQFKAEFVKTRRMPLFTRDLTVRGRLVFQKPNRSRLTMVGDVNVEILSDGETISLVHDLRDQEIYHVKGQGDLSQFADPLMLLIDSFGRGALRQYSILSRIKSNDSMMLVIKPGHKPVLEIIDKVYVWFSTTGELRKVRILFDDGGIDETVFKSWAMLPEDDPEIVSLDRRLKEIVRNAKVEEQSESPYHCACRLRRDRLYPAPFLVSPGRAENYFWPSLAAGKSGSESY